MKKILFILSTLLVIGCLTGCGNKEEIKEGENPNNSDENQQVNDENIIYEGLEFVSVGISNGVVTTIVINNTGTVFNGSKFLMKIMDENGNVLIETVDEVKESMESGTTKTIETNVEIDLSQAVSIEYSITK